MVDAKQQLDLELQSFKIEISKLKQENSEKTVDFKYENDQLVKRDVREQGEIYLQKYDLKFEKLNVQKSSSPLTIELMIRSAFQNKNQKEGDSFTKNDIIFTYKQFKTFEDILSTMPSKRVLSAINQYLAKHPLLPCFI